MKKVKKSFRRVLAPTIGVLLMAGMVACSDEITQKTDSTSQTDANQQEETFTIDIMTMAHTPEPPRENSPAIIALEELTNTNLNIQFVPSTSYADRFNITLASGNLPHIMLTENKSPSFINAVKDGAFWDLTDYIGDYENLSEMNEIVLNNISVDGRIYGIYRSRPLGRNAVTIRTDWLENVGLDKPETIDDLYEVLKAFTNDDPNKSGQDDTFGMVVSEFEGPWNVMQTWFGVPNKWGETASGELIPDFMTDEYREALAFFRKLHEEGLVNEDFAVMDPGQWFDPIVNGQAGLVVDVADQAHRLQNRILEADPEQEGVLDLFGAVEGPNGLFNLPTSGYAGMFAISTTSVKSEEELRKVLQFLDELNSEEGQIIGNNGVEGRHFEFVDGNFKQISLDNPNLMAEHQDLNQLQMFIPENRFLFEEKSNLNVRSDEVILENEDIVVGNPAEPLISTVYAQRGQQLDNIVNDARIQYIVGQIDEKGLDDAVALWKRSGGDDYMAEINQLYQEALAASE